MQDRLILIINFEGVLGSIRKLNLADADHWSSLYLRPGAI